MQTTFQVPGKAKPKARPRCAKRGRRVFAYTPPETLEYENHVARHAVFPEGWPLDADYVVAIEVWHDTNIYGDLDNIAKSVLDALNTHGGAWKDDKQVSQLLMARRFDTENPRIEVSIRAVAAEKAKKRSHPRAARAQIENVQNAQQQSKNARPGRKGTRNPG